MNKIKKSLIALTAAAMLAGSCIGSPAFAVDNTLNGTTKSKEIEVTINVAGGYTATIPQSISMEKDTTGDKHQISSGANCQINKGFKIEPGKKLQLKVGYKSKDGTTTEYDGNIKFYHDTADDDITINLTNCTNGVLLESGGVTEDQTATLSGIQADDDLDKGKPKYTGDYKAKVVFSIDTVDAQT